MTFDPNSVILPTSLNPKAHTPTTPYILRAMHNGKRVQYEIGQGFWAQNNLNTMGLNIGQDPQTSLPVFQIVPEADAQTLKTKQGATSKGSKFYADWLTPICVGQGLIEDKKGTYFLTLEAVPDAAGWFYVKNDPSIDNKVQESASTDGDSGTPDGTPDQPSQEQLQAEADAEAQASNHLGEQVAG